MPLFPSLPDQPHLSDVFQAFPEHVRPLLEYHDVLLRGDGPLSPGERELIAAYVSGLNACSFCYGAHKRAAQAFGMEEALMDKLVEDLDSAPIDEKMKPLLRYVAKLKTLPPKLTDEDASAVYGAGWSERALYDAVQIAALYNFMNRIIEGTGVSFQFEPGELTDAERERRASKSAYSDWGKSLGVFQGSN